MSALLRLPDWLLVALICAVLIAAAAPAAAETPGRLSVAPRVAKHEQIIVGDRNRFEWTFAPKVDPQWGRSISSTSTAMSASNLSPLEHTLWTRPDRKCEAP